MRDCSGSAEKIASSGRSALDGEVAGVQVSEAGKQDWEESEEEGVESEEAGEVDGQVGEMGEVNAEWLDRARQVAQADYR